MFVKNFEKYKISEKAFEDNTVKRAVTPTGVHFKIQAWPTFAVLLWTEPPIIQLLIECALPSLNREQRLEIALTVPLISNNSRF